MDVFERLKDPGTVNSSFPGKPPAARGGPHLGLPSANALGERTGARASEPYWLRER